MPLCYVDASAIVKTVVEEAESSALIAFTAGADLVSCELVLTELERALRRAAALESDFELEPALDQAATQLASLALLPLERGLLLAAGSLREPSLRALDAIHVAAAQSVEGLDGFVTYDIRQAAAARLSGLRTFSPGA